MNIGSNVLNNLDSKASNPDSKQSGVGQSVAKPLVDADSPIDVKGFSSVLQVTESAMPPEAQLLQGREPTTELMQNQAKTQVAAESADQHAVSQHQINTGSFVETASDSSAKANSALQQMTVDTKVIPQASASPSIVAKETPKDSLVNGQPAQLNAAKASLESMSQLTAASTLGKSQVTSEKSAVLPELKGSASVDHSVGRDFTQNQVFKATLPSKDASTAEVGQKLVAILADKVSLQSNAKVSNATIRLDPPELGKLDLFVRVEGDRLNVHINSSNSGVREAIAQTVERLRLELTQENFLQVNVTLGDSNETAPDWQGELDANSVEQVIATNSGDSIQDEPDTNITEQVLARV